MKYEIKTSRSYRKNRKKLLQKDKDLLEVVIKKLANGETLESKYNDHALSGNYKDFRDCHIKPDLILVYRINKNILELYLLNIGSHSELGL